jgi:predicted  nucleic acid-binding Zn-ribbon protein
MVQEKIMATNDDLARMMARGFTEIQERFEKVDERFNRLEEKVDTNFRRTFSAITVLQGQVANIEGDIRQLKREIVEIHKVL